MGILARIREAAAHAISRSSSKYATCTPTRASPRLSCSRRRSSRPNGSRISRDVIGLEPRTTMIDPHEAPVCNRADPCHICYVTKQSPHPYYLKIRPCNAHVDRHRWEILDNEGLLQTSADSFATEREAKDNGRLEMQGLIEIWNKK